MTSMTLQQALELAVNYHHALRLPEAEDLYRKILTHDPRQVDCLYGLGGVLLQNGRAVEAIEALRQAVTLKPEDPTYRYALGTALVTAANFEDAIRALQTCVSLRPDYAEAYNLLGNAYFATSQLANAVAAYRRALEIQPLFPQALGNLSQVLTNCGQLEDAIRLCRHGLARWPQYTTFHRILGLAHRESGQLDDAIQCYRQVIASENDPQLHSDLLFTLHFHADYDRQRLFQEHAEFNERYGRPLSTEMRPHSNDRTPDRRLRLGYVASDLGDNALGRFLLPLLEHHDPKEFEIFCYCDHPRPDAIGERLRSFGQWPLVASLSHEMLADRVRAERIDILVDLSMHSNRNRLLMFARKPAPVQVTYLAYCSTTGLEAIDYRLTDRYLDPPDSSDSFYAEKSFRLPNCYWSYVAPEVAPAVAPLPALRKGYVTFGCLNDFSKVTPRCISTWCALLSELPGSRLQLHAKQGTHRERTLNEAVRQGIDPHRIEFIPRQRFAEYLNQYKEIDIALDPFPWAGGATSFDAIYMGAPLVTLAGETAVSRGGLSILSNLRLSELVASDTSQYIRIAAGLARDLPRLDQLRSSLRSLLKSSRMMDAPGFAHDIEIAFRQMWRTWCGEPSRQ